MVLSPGLIRALPSLGRIRREVRIKGWNEVLRERGIQLLQMSLPKPLSGASFVDDPKLIIVDNGMDPSLQDVTIAHEYAHELFDHWPGIRDTNQEVEAEVGAFLLTCPMSFSELRSYLRNNPEMSHVLFACMVVFFPSISKEEIVALVNLPHGWRRMVADLILLILLRLLLDEINRFRFQPSLRVPGTSGWSRFR